MKDMVLINPSIVVKLHGEKSSPLDDIQNVTLRAIIIVTVYNIKSTFTQLQKSIILTFARVQKNLGRVIHNRREYRIKNKNQPIM